MNNDEMSPKNDAMFKRLFGKKGNERIVKDFLEAVLDIEIESVELEKETQIIPEHINEKLGILDVRAKLSNGAVVDIEMQNINYGNIEKRITYYLNRLYTSELKKGKSYNDLNKAIAIGVLNFDYFKDIEQYHTKWKMTEQNNKDKVLEEQEIHFIELPKFIKSKKNMNRKIEQWLAFIDYRDKGLVEMAKEKNEVIKEAASEYEYLTGEAAEQRLAFLREKGERDYISGMEYAKNIGIEQGGKDKQLEIAKKMKDKNIPTDEIIEITGLTKEEIEKL